MRWRLTAFVVRRRAGVFTMIAPVVAFAIGALLVGAAVAARLSAPRSCVLDVRGFTTVYGDTAVHEVVWIDQADRRVATLDVIDTPGVAGLASVTLPCGIYTVRAPPAPAADTAAGRLVTLRLFTDQDYLLGRPLRSVVGTIPAAP